MKGREQTLGLSGHKEPTPTKFKTHISIKVVLIS